MGQRGKVALVIGATGVTGKPLTRCLLDSGAYSSVIAFTRRPTAYDRPEYRNVLIDFDDMDEWGHELDGDDLFSALGTTRKQAGSKDAQYKVDFHYQANACRAAAHNGVRRLFLVSSPSADANSPFFYMRIKGELDDLVATLGFDTLVYFRPSIIEGQRPDGRPAEKVGGAVMRFASSRLPGLSKYRPISGDELGRAIVNCATGPLASGTHTFELDEIFGLLDQG